MFPLQDDVPARHPPFMNWALIVINAVVFWLQISLPERQLVELFDAWGLVPARAEASGWLVGWQHVTSMFLHGGWFHVFSNMWMLWIFGDNVEDRMGPARYLAFYLACGVLAGVTHVQFNATSQVPTVGASGAIAGVMGAYVLLYPRARVLTLIPVLFIPFFFDLPAVLFLGIWFAGQIVSATWTLVRPEQVGGIAWWAHIGGFVAGLVTVLLFCSRDRHPRRLQRDEWSRMDVWRRMR